MRKSALMFICLLAGTLFLFNESHALSGSSIFEDIVLMEPGSVERRQLMIEDSYSLENPTANFGDLLVLTFGEAGTLSIEVDALANMLPGSVMYYALVGLSYSSDEGAKAIFKTASTPFLLEESIPVNSFFGFVQIIYQENPESFIGKF